MSAVDFGAWATPALPIMLGGRTYSVRPPSVADGPRVIALAIWQEKQVGLVKGEIPAEVQAILDEVLAADDHPSVGREVHDVMVADGVDAVTIARAELYATLYWARGREYADEVGRLMWEPLTEAVDASPKASRSRSGRRGTTPRSGSVSQSTATPTASPNTPITTPSRSRRSAPGSP